MTAIAPHWADVSVPAPAVLTSTGEAGLHITVPRDVVLTDPITIVLQAHGDDVSIDRQLHIVLEAGAQAQIVVEYRGTGSYRNQSRVDVQLHDGAFLQCHLIQQESLQAQHMCALRMQQAPHSQSTVHVMSFGGHTVRTDLGVVLDERASCHLNGLTLARGDQVNATYVRVEHAKPHSRSEQVFKSVLNDKARTVFDGLIHVSPHAQKIDARQNSRTLLLSRHAQANNNPHLEILADDVKCSHGSSTGVLSADAEFYLRARGIDAVQARAILVQAFASDSIDAITLAPLRAQLEQALIAYLAIEHTV